VGKPSLIQLPFDIMKELTLERNPINVSNVVKPTFFPVPFAVMKELTLERNPMHVTNVENSSLV
jgi:hypothetical protein